MDSPVPASMFAPEPSSPGAARAAAAAARLHDGYDSDCSEDGEALNGEPELDLTNKVGPGAGSRAKWDQVPGDPEVGRAVSRATAGAGAGGAEPAHLPLRTAPGVPGRWAAPGGPPPPSFSRRLRPGLPPSGSRGDRSPSTPPRGTRVPDTGCAPRGATSSDAERGPLDCPRQPGAGGAWAGEWRRGRTRSEAGRGGVSSWRRERKQKVVAQPGRRMAELCLLCKSTQNQIESWTGPVISPSWEWNHNLYECNNEGRFKSCPLSS